MPGSDQCVDGHSARAARRSAQQSGTYRSVEAAGGATTTLRAQANGHGGASQLPSLQSTEQMRVPLASVLENPGGLVNTLAFVPTDLMQRRSTPDVPTAGEPPE